MKIPGKKSILHKLIKTESDGDVLLPPVEAPAGGEDAVLISRQKLQDFTSDLFHLLYNDPASLPKAGTPAELTRAVQALVERLLGVPSEPQPAQPPRRPALRSLSLEEREFYQRQMRLLSEIGTGLWRLRQRLVSPETDQPLEEMRRAYRSFTPTWDALQEAGITVQDHTRAAYDPHMALRVLAFEPTPGITRDVILETIKPSVYYQQRCIQMGEVIVATPAEMPAPQPPDEAQPA